jgi:hypothetical protein
MRSNRPIASDLLADGWLSPRAAAAALGVTVGELEARARRGEIKRKQLVPNSSLYLYEVTR